jgi:hypothetical protein
MVSVLYESGASARGYIDFGSYDNSRIGGRNIEWAYKDSDYYSGYYLYTANGVMVGDSEYLASGKTAWFSFTFELNSGYGSIWTYLNMNSEMIYVSKKVARNIVRRVMEGFNYEVDEASGRVLYDCSTPTLPNVKFRFYSIWHTIRGQDYMLRKSVNGVDICYLAFAINYEGSSWSFGTPFFADYHTVFDYSNER